MAQCKWCENKGFFLKVNQYGVCDKCFSFIIIPVQQSIQIIEESTKIVERTKKFDVATSRCDLIIPEI